MLYNFGERKLYYYNNEIFIENLWNYESILI